MPYATKDDLESYLGVDFSAAQEAAITNILIPAVDALIDDRTSRRWSVALQEETFVRGSGPYLWLKHKPVSSITSITYKTAYNQSAVVLASSYYALEDAETGRVYIPSLGDYYSVTVTYSPSATLEPRLKLAACIILAHYIQPLLSGISMGLKSFSVAGTISVTYDNGLEEEGIPVEAAKILEDLNTSGGFVFA